MMQSIDIGTAFSYNNNITQKRTGNHMIKVQRHNEILKLLEQQDAMQISALAELLQCSMMTVHRDIEELEQQSLVRKVHGGVVLQRNDDLQPSFNRRVVQNTEEKRRIAAEALKMIEPGSSVFFDAGTTPLYLTKIIPANLAFTAITNSLQTAVELAGKPNITVIILAGEIHHSSYSAVNNLAIESASKFHTDLAIISTKSISLPGGIYETSLPLIEIKNAMVRNTKKVVLLADHSKFNESAMCLAVGFEDIDVVITDTGTPEDKVKKLRELGVEVKVV
ncbi:hypothetical protein AR437_10020 [Christensenella hongkongensis]|nr:hypothetical protein AR437_10020 [Christensenella hongkongensis]